jgi:tRNA G18 (ribose-2'-O)-methylase SpoU
MKEHQLSFGEINKEHLKKISEINKNRLPICILTDGINDVGNIGMIFRLADALRIEKIYLYDLRNALNFKLLKKKSRSTTEYVSFEIVNNINNVLKLKEKYKFIILDKTNKSINYADYKPEFPLCLIIGSEKFGISKEIIELADVSLHLPVYGVNTSINAATATAVALYDIANKFKNYE